MGWGNFYFQRLQNQNVYFLNNLMNYYSFNAQDILMPLKKPYFNFFDIKWKRVFHIALECRIKYF